MKENNRVAVPEDWELMGINIVNKILANIATLYNEPPEIVVKNADGKDNKEATDLYNKLLNDYGLMKERKRLNRHLLAFNTIIGEMKFRNNKIDYEIYSPHICYVETEEDYLVPKLIKIGYDGSVVEGYREQIIYKTFEKNRCYWTNTKGEMVSVIDLEHGFEDYLIITRLENQGEFWGEGYYDVVAINTEINLLLSTLLTHSLYQGGSILFGVNISDSASVNLGANKMLHVKASGLDVPPSLQYVSPQNNTEAIVRAIDYLIKTAYNLKGLSATTYTLEATEQSGIAKMLDNAEMYETRIKQIDIFKNFENEFFRKFKNFYNACIDAGLLGGKRLNGEYVEVDYIDPNPYYNEKEEIEILKQKIDLGIANPLDYIKENNKDAKYTDEEAEQILQRNIEIKNRLNEKYGNIFGTRIFE